MLVLLLCIIAFVIVTVLQKRNNHILERCKNGKTFTETVEESLRREKTLKIIRYIICYTFLGLLAIFMLVPFYWMINTSLKTAEEIDFPKPTWFPKKIAWENYYYIFSEKYQKRVSGTVRFYLWRNMYNTLIIGVISTIGTVITTVMAAFAFSRIKFPGREVIFTLFLATMMIPGEMMVITNYITVTKTAKNVAKTLFGIKNFTGVDSYWALIVPFLISVYYIYLLRQNFKQIPDELYYAAKVDGTSDFKYLIKIMIPIAMPTIITITILKLMGSWNAYVWPEMITRKQEMKLISNGLRTSFNDSSGRTNQGYQMAAAFAVTMPLLIVFIFLRKYLMRGVSRSGIKG